MSLIATFDVDETETANPDGGDNGRHRLRHSIYLGGKTDAKDYAKLVNRWNISHVLNCTPPKQTNIEAGVPNYFKKPKLPDQKRLVYHRIPIYDSPTSLPDLQSEHESSIIKFVTKGLCHGNVLVHCSRGVSRSTTSVILYLMAKKEYSYVAALDLIRRRRPEAQPIPAFEAWLKERDVFYRNQRESSFAAAEPITTENSEAHSSKKRKRAISGPSIGPALPPMTAKGSSVAMGPSPPPPAIGPELSPLGSPQITTASIGPDFPTAEKKSKKKKKDKKTKKKHRNDKTVESSPTLPAIGPALPP
jgi:protein-tyrosine phosphatase